MRIILLLLLFKFKFFDNKNILTLLKFTIMITKKGSENIITEMAAKD